MRVWNVFACSHIVSLLDFVPLCFKFKKERNKHLFWDYILMVCCVSTPMTLRRTYYARKVDEK